MAHTLDTTIRYPDDATSTSNANPVNATITVNAAATALAVGLLYANSANNRTGTAPTAGGVTMYQANATQKAATSPEGVVEVWYLPDPPTGSVALAIPNTATLGIKVVAASFIAQANYSSKYDTANGTNATSTNPTVSVTPTVDGAAVFGMFSGGLANCVTGFSSNTGIEISKFDLGSFGGASQYYLQANANAFALGYTANSDDWAAVAVVFKEQIKVQGTLSQTLDTVTIASNGTVATPSAKFGLAASANIAANAATATTAQLTAPANKTTANFGAASISDDTNPLPAVNLTANQYTEVEWSVSAGANVAANEVYTFRVTANGTELTTYSANATWTIGTTVSNATVTQTLAALTQDLTAGVQVAGVVSQTLGALTQDLTATVAVAADVQQGLADVTLTATATVDVQGVTEQTLDAVTLEATGTVEDVGLAATVDAILESVTIEATGTVDVAGVVEQDLASITTEATGTVDVAGVVEQTLEAVALSAEGTAAVSTDASLTQTLDALTAEITGTVAVAGTVSQTLASLTVSSTGTTGGPIIHALLASARYPATANTTNAANPISFSFTAGTNATAVAVGMIYAGITNRAGGAPTYANQTMLQAATRRGTTEASAEVWYLCDPPAGASTVSIPNTGTLATKVYVASFKTPYGYTSVYDTANGANATSTNPTSSVTTTANGDAIFGVVASGLNDWLAGSSNQVGTVLYEDDCGAWGGGAQYLIQANAGTQAVGWTANSDDWGTVSLALKLLSLGPQATVNQTLGDVTCTATAAYLPVILWDSANIAGTANSTGQLTPPAGKTVVGYFQPGYITDESNPMPSVNLVVNTYTEMEWSLRGTGAATQGGTYSFRVTANGTALDTYAVTPTWILLDAVSATVAQTLGSVTLSATTITQEPGTGFVTQTLEAIGQEITGSTGRAAEVSQTLGNISEPKLFCDTSGLGGGTPTGYNFYFGRVPNTPTQVVPVAYTANLEILLTAVAPDTGEWYVSVTAYNAGGETTKSNELFVVVPTFTATVEDVSGVATVEQTLASVSLAAAAKVDVKASTGQTLAAIGRTITGTVEVKGATSQTLGQVARAITATVEVQGTVSQTLGSVACVATATRTFGEVQAVVAQTLGSVECVATGLVYETGTRAAQVNAQLADVQASITAVVPVAAVVDQSLGSVSIVSTASVYETGSHTAWVDSLLESVQSDMAGTVLVSGTVNALLESVQSTVAGVLPVTAAVNQGLQPVGQAISASNPYWGMRYQNILLDGS